MEAHKAALNLVVAELINTPELQWLIPLSFDQDGTDPAGDNFLYIFLNKNICIMGLFLLDMISWCLIIDKSALL